MDKVTTKKEMRMFKILMVISFVFLLTACDSKSDPTSTFGNGHIYEFTPKTNAKKTCVLALYGTGWGGRNVGLQCFDK